MTAYLAVASGKWKMAEAICADATYYSGVGLGDAEHATEIHILACSILRIYRTDIERLTKADERLNMARSLFPKGMDEQRVARIESEEMSIRANRFMYINFERSSKVVEYDARPEPTKVLLNDLIKHATSLMRSNLPDDVKSKLIANAGVNIVTVMFCSRSDLHKPDKNQVKEILSCLNVSWRRISASNTRVSYYEEIVTIFSIRDLKEFHLTHPVDLEVLEQKLKEKNNYREIALRTSPFEQWVLKHFV